MALQQLVGVAALSVDAVLFTVWCAITKYLTADAWPVYRMEGCACYINAVALIILLMWCGHCRRMPANDQLGWLIVRGFCGAGDVLCRVIATCLGTSLGDVAALTSINMVFAAFLGHLFLNEDLGFQHILAVCCSVSGAILISKPEFLFDRSEDVSNPWVGQALGILSGFFSASGCICSRKSAATPLLHVVLACQLVVGTSSMLVPCILHVDDASLGKLNEFPQESIALLGMICFIFVGGSYFYNVGAAWCPAAITSTVYCSMSMFSGYVAQSVLFGQIPSISSLAGTALMFSGVVIMTAVRRPNENCLSTNVENNNGEVVEQDSSDTASVTSKDSIASFVAMEFAECAPRQRRLHLVRPLINRRDIVAAIQVTA